MKKFRLMLWIQLLMLPLIVFSSFSGCEKEEEEEMIAEAYVSVSPEGERVFESLACSDTLVVSSSGTWQVVSLPDWITAQPMSGADGDTLVLAVQANSNTSLRSAVFSVQCDVAKVPVRVMQYGHVATDFVDLRLGQSGVSANYSASGTLSVSYADGRVPSVSDYQAFVLPSEYGYDIRVVESVSVNGNTLNLQTSQGNMCNLFRNIGFTLATNPNASTRSTDGKRVITPSSFGYLDENGVYHETYNAATRAVYPIEQQLWSFSQSYSGETLWSGNAGIVSWKKCEFDAGLDATFTFDFGEKTISQVRKLGDLKKFSCQLHGNVGADMLLNYHYEHSYSESDDAIIKYNVLPTGVFRFVVGTVPVVILVYTHLGKQHSFSAKGSVDVTGGLKMGCDVNVGMEWTPASGVTPQNEAVPTFIPYPLTVEAKASVEGKVSYYPQIEIGVYKFLGPWLEPRPYLKQQVEAGFRASTDGENHLGWKAESYNGLDLRMGLKMDFGMWDKEVWKSEVYNPVKDRLLFEAPSRIRTLLPKDGTEVESGKSVTAEFIVESFNAIMNEYVPCPLALVNFKADGGKLESEVAVADADGKVTVEWTPSASGGTETRSGEKQNRTLTARIVDKDGKEIEKATLIVKIEKGESCSDANHVHAVDLGLSVKWACCNVGASVPEGYGNYYAWGETATKSSYYSDNSTTYGLSYSELQSRGIIGSDGNLTASYDAATANWGGSWRMPTHDEIKELVNNCTWKWTTYNGVNGRLVTGPNGNSIFLPAAGYRFGTDLYNAGSSGYYWSATPLSDSYYAYYLYFYSGNYDWDYYDYRYYGHAVRPVSE